MNALRMVTLTGVAAGVAVVLAMLLYLKVTGRPLMDRAALSERDRAAERRLTLPAAVSPWLILTFFSLLINTPSLPFFELTFTRFAMPVEVIPGAAEKVRLFWQAYFWILVSTALALPFLRPTRSQLRTSVAKWLRRAPRPVAAAAVFFAIAFVINHSGKGADWQLADVNRASAFGQLYPLVAPFLGLLGGFISGSETSSIAMLTELHLATSEKIGASGLLVAAASGIGGGLASVISPAKLQNASASIDRIGQESEVMRSAFGISLLITAVVGLMAMLWA
jgi:lactate permease